MDALNYVQKFAVRHDLLCPGSSPNSIDPCASTFSFARSATIHSSGTASICQLPGELGTQFSSSTKLILCLAYFPLCPVHVPLLLHRIYLRLMFPLLH